MDIRDYIGKEVTIKIDRPMGSKHPKFDSYYPINYGFVPGTIAPDGDEYDVYLLGVFKPVKEYVGKCIAFIRRIDYDGGDSSNEKKKQNATEDKLVVTPVDKKYTDEQIMALCEFQERWFKSEIIR